MRLTNHPGHATTEQTLLLGAQIAQLLADNRRLMDLAINQEDMIKAQDKKIKELSAKRGELWTAN